MQDKRVFGPLAALVWFLSKLTNNHRHFDPAESGREIPCQFIEKRQEFSRSSG